MNTLNTVLTKIHDVVLAPLASSPLWALVVVSAISGVVMTWVFGKTSNQRALGAVADRARAQLLGMKLFRDDARVVLRYQWELLKSVGGRLAHSLPPMLVLAIPFSVILIQLAQRYEHRPLAVGEQAVVELRLSPDAWPERRRVMMEVPEGVVVETPALHDEAVHTISWRVRVAEPTTTPIRWRVGAGETQKGFAAATETTRLQVVSPRRAGRGIGERLLYPSEPALPADSAVTGIEVHYPRRTTPVFGFDVPWWVTFLVVSMLAAVVVRPFMKVRF